MRGGEQEDGEERNSKNGGKQKERKRIKEISIGTGRMQW